MENKDLYHYGVKGMKWGVRRYQNYDGTLTDAGRSQRINGIAKGSPMTPDEADRGKCNPNKPDRWADYEEYKNQLNEKGGYVYNCQSCAVTYEARIRGYDIIAGSRSNNPTADMIQDDISKAFIDPTTGKPPVAKKFDCNVSESTVKRWRDAWWADADVFDNSQAMQKEVHDMWTTNDNNWINVDKMLTDTIKPGERYLVKTKTFNLMDSDDYREHYMAIDWTNSEEPLAIETQSTHSWPDKVRPNYSDKTRRNYISNLGIGDDEIFLGVELTRVDNCDLNYDVVEKVTERSKR